MTGSFHSFPTFLVMYCSIPRSSAGGNARAVKKAVIRFSSSGLGRYAGGGDATVTGSFAISCGYVCTGPYYVYGSGGGLHENGEI